MIRKKTMSGKKPFLTPKEILLQEINTAATNAIIQTINEEVKEIIQEEIPKYLPKEELKAIVKEAIKTSIKRQFM